MEEAYKKLAIAVIEQALLDLRGVPITAEQKIAKGTAREFFRGGKDSPLAFWCDMSGIDRMAMQEKMEKWPEMRREK